MSFTLRKGRNWVREGLLWTSCLILAVFVTGCCTCKIPSDKNVVLIVSQPDALVSNQANAEAALHGFGEKLENGDTIRLVNKFGKTVTVKFPGNVIDGPLQFDIKRCKERVVTIKFVGPPPDAFLIDFQGGPGHGGAKIIVDPG